MRAIFEVGLKRISSEEVLWAAFHKTRYNLVRAQLYGLKAMHDIRQMLLA